MKLKIKIAVIGVGYVGLPVAISLSKHFDVIAYDNNRVRITELTKGKDTNLDISKKDLSKKSNTIKFTYNFNEIKKCNFYIITLPTPVNNKNQPNLKNISKVNYNLSKILKRNDIVVYESTVYPGCTENRFVKELKKFTSFEYNKDFYVGYSPERINPGDKNKKIHNINKLVSASNKKALSIIKKVYELVVTDAKVITTKSIIVAESAKIIENTQRDLNIALINEFSLILKKLNVSRSEVLKAAKTKWNFLDFHPGLVGGHCIGVDPYYLAFIAKKIKIKPNLILSGRNLNENYYKTIIGSLINNASKKNIDLSKSNLLLCGLTFKSNTPDLRNSQTLKIYKKIMNKVGNIDLYDPIVKKDLIFNIYKKQSVNKLKKNTYDIIVITVKHKEFLKNKKLILSSLKPNRVIIDIPQLFNEKIYDATL